MVTVEDFLNSLGAKNGYCFTMSEFIKKGFSRQKLYSLYQKGKILKIGRGVYCMPEDVSNLDPDYGLIFKKHPEAVLCLISALSYYNLTTQIPKQISIALPRGSRIPQSDVVALDVHRFSAESFSSGVEKKIHRGVQINVYCAEKTLCDIFKYRNKIGVDIFMEALRFYKSRYKFKPNLILKFARVNRVDKVILPYLESMV